MSQSDPMPETDLRRAERAECYAAAFRQRRWEKSRKYRSVWKGEVGSGAVTGLIGFLVAPGWNVAAGIGCGILGSVIWHYCFAPVIRYIWVVPVEEHIDQAQRIHELQTELDGIQAAVLPKARLVFDPRDDNYVQHERLVSGSGRRFRIGIVNLSQASLRSCRLVLEQTEPFEAHVTHLGHPMGDRLQENGVFDVHPREDGKASEYVDVLQEIVLENNKALMRFTYAPAGWHSDIFKSGKYFEITENRVFTFRFEGVDLRAEKMRLRVSWKQDQRQYDVTLE